jgi:hypothetical protein
MHATLTVKDKIYLAAMDLPEWFHQSELIVHCWSLWPAEFGLKDYEDRYPHSAKVIAELSGDKSLVGRGNIIRHPETKLLKVGVKPECLFLRGAGAAPETAALSAADRRLLASLLISEACRLFDRGRKEEMTCRQALTFWGLSDTAPVEEISERLEYVRKALATIEDALQEPATLANGQQVKAADVRVLRHIDVYLSDRFESRLKCGEKVERGGGGKKPKPASNTNGYHPVRADCLAGRNGKAVVSEAHP